MTTVSLEPVIDVDEAMRICSKAYVLSFKNFVRVKNNFQLHFTLNFFGSIYRSQAAYCKCVTACPAFGNFATRLMLCHDFNKHLPELYEAYKLMRPYAETNWEMFR